MIEYRSHSRNKLSGGLKQRVAIAGVIAMDQNVSCWTSRRRCSIKRTERCDPHGAGTAEKETGDGDPDHALYGKKVIDADRVYVMDHGRVVMDGTPREIFSRVEELKQYGMDVPQAAYAGGGASETWIGSAAGILHSEELVEHIMALKKR